MSYITKYLTIIDLNQEKAIALNALSGAVDIIDKATKEKILNIKNSKCINFDDEDLEKNLKNRGYLFDTQEEEEEIIKNIQHVYRNYIDSKMLSFVICPTTACNLRCTYCFESEEVRSSKQVMSKDQIDVIFSNIENIKKERNPERMIIQLFGGEPLLKTTKEINSYIFKKAKENNMPIFIISNGTNIRYYEDLFKEYSDIVENIQITIDGVKAIHDVRRIRIDKSGTFDEIVDGIDILLENNIKTSVRVNVDGQNIDTMKEFVEFINMKKWTDNKYFFCDIAPVTDHHNSNDIDELMEENEIVKKMIELFPNYQSDNSIFRLSMFRVLNHINKALGLFDATKDTYSLMSYCEANSLQYYVFTPEGKVYACPETIGNEEYEIGTFGEKMVLDDARVSMWNGRSIYNIPECMQCAIAPFCGGGCAYAALKINGDINKPVCDNAQRVLETYINSIKDYILEKYA